MVVLSYDTAKRSLIMMAVYLVCISLLIKGVSHLLEYNVSNAFQSLLNGSDFTISLPEFNWDSLSFEWIASLVREKVQNVVYELLHVILPTIIGTIDLMWLRTFSTKQAISLGTRKLFLKA